MSLSSSTAAFFKENHSRIPPLEKMVVNTYGMPKIFQLAKMEIDEIKSLKEIPEEKLNPEQKEKLAPTRPTLWKTYEKKFVKYLCEQIMSAQLQEVKAMLNVDSSILFETCDSVQDKAGRTFVDITPFRCWVAVEDFYVETFDAFKTYIDKVKDGREIAIKQLCQQFPEADIEFPAQFPSARRPATIMNQERKEYYKAMFLLDPIVEALKKEEFMGNQTHYLVKLEAIPESKELLPTFLLESVRGPAYVRHGEKLFYVDTEKKACVEIDTHVEGTLLGFDLEVRATTTPRALAKEDFEKIHETTGHLVLNTNTEKAMDHFRAMLQQRGNIRTGKAFNNQLPIVAHKLFAENKVSWESRKYYFFLFQVIGGIQRYFTSNLAAAHCQGLLHETDDADILLPRINALDRSFNVASRRSHLPPDDKYNFYPIDQEPYGYRLGFDFVIIGYCTPYGFRYPYFSEGGGPVDGVPDPEIALKTVENHYKMKIELFNQFKNWLRTPAPALANATNNNLVPRR